MLPLYLKHIVLGSNKRFLSVCHNDLTPQYGDAQKHAEHNQREYNGLQPE